MQNARIFFSFSGNEALRRGLIFRVDSHFSFSALARRSRNVRFMRRHQSAEIDKRLRRNGGYRSMNEVAQ